MEATREQTKIVPPYLPYSTFERFLGMFDHNGVTDVIDRTVLGKFSGTAYTQLINALRYLRLIDTYSNTLPLLDRLVKAEGSERTTVMREIVKGAYPFLFTESFNLGRATPGQLADRFRDAGASGDTVRKCISFFVNAAREADLEISPFISKTSATQSAGSAPKARNTRSARAKASPSRKQAQRSEPVTGATTTLAAPPAATPNFNTQPDSWRQQLIDKFPAFDVTWEPAIKAQWFDAMKELMQLLGKDAADKRAA